MVRMPDTAAKQEPAFTIFPAGDDFLDSRVYDDRIVGSILQSAGDEFATAYRNIGYVDAGRGCLRHQWRKPAVANAFGNAVFKDHVVEDLAVAVIEPPTVEPKRCSREPTDPHRRFE